MALVLCIGRELALMETRRLILEAAGHTVVPAMSIPQLEQAYSKHEFDVVVIGQGIPAKEKLRIFDLVRRICPTSKVLELHTFPSEQLLKGADDSLIVPAEIPSEFAQRVATLAKRKTSPPKKRSRARRANS